MRSLVALATAVSWGAKERYCLPSLRQAGKSETRLAIWQIPEASGGRLESMEGDWPRLCMGRAHTDP
jgi:hypothetical protein